MAKISLVAKPTFHAMVAIPVAGAEPVSVKFEFRHRTRTQLEEFIKARAAKPDAEAFGEMVVGWELEDEFTPENVHLLLESYIGAAVATYRTYIDELVKTKLGN